MLAASWEPHDEQVEFRLVGRPKGDSVWIALGFSADGKMVRKLTPPPFTCIFVTGRK